MTNPWLGRRVVAYAHQGGAREGPSSTLFAMRSALAAGATAIELDVHATADGELVVCHDPTLERTTSGRGAIAEQRLSDIERLDAGYWFVPGEDACHGRPPRDYPLRGLSAQDPSLRPATLRSVLEAFPGVALNLDIKQTAPLVRPYEEALARLLRDHGRRDDVIVASFHDEAIERFRSFAPEIGTAAGRRAVSSFAYALWSRRRPGHRLAGHVALQVPVRARGVRLVTRRFVDAAHELGLAVHVWTVDDPAEIERLVRAGVDGVMSDRPSLLASVLRRLGATWADAPGLPEGT